MRCFKCDSEVPSANRGACVHFEFDGVEADFCIRCLTVLYDNFGCDSGVISAWIARERAQKAYIPRKVRLAVDALEGKVTEVQREIKRIRNEL